MRTRTRVLSGGVTTRSMTKRAGKKADDAEVAMIARRRKIRKGKEMKGLVVGGRAARTRASRRSRPLPKNRRGVPASPPVPIKKQKLPKLPKAPKAPKPPKNIPLFGAATAAVSAPSYFGLFGTSEPIRLIDSHDADFMKLKTTAIIVTIHSSSSCDPHFTNNRQKSAQGTKTAIYQARGQAIDLLLQGFEGKSSNPTVKQLFQEMAQLDPDCTAFNWQCSGGYSPGHFPQGAEKVLRLVKGLLDRRHMVMFSDFSLKALIAQWMDKYLGPNPFIHTGGFSGNAKLHFDPVSFTNSPSAQLQSIGDLSEQGVCDVHCPGGTTVYTVNMNKAKNKAYEFQILSVVSNTTCTAAQTLNMRFGKGTAGHVLLTYPTGGRLLASMTHWAQLSKVQTSEKKLKEIAQKQYGQMEVDQIAWEMAQVPESEKPKYITEKAKYYVKNAAPCNNKATKKKYNQK